MSTIDQQFVEFIVKSLVSNPDSVEIKRTIDEKGVLLELTVAQEDLGRVIGKRGATAQSIRTLLRALGTKNEARYNLKIVDPEGGAPAQRRSFDEVEKDTSSSEEGSSEEKEEKVLDEESPEEAPAEEPEEAEEESQDDEETEDEEDSMVARHRRDLADLDD